jgi:acetylornithine deacetylase/succinyl-diaminopimelate desuccinylase-like protein
MYSGSVGDDAIALLRQLVRSACVNDGAIDSGQEQRNVAVLQRFFADTGLTLDVVEPHPGRSSVVVRIAGSDPDAPSLALVGHLDVVPVQTDGWSRDPFEADIVDGVIYGRGTLDMLYLTASYAAVVRAAALSGFQPNGDLIFAGVADEESGSSLGVEWLTEHHLDLIDADFVLTESGGVPVGEQDSELSAADGVRRPRAVMVSVGEKGLARRRLLVRGTPGHGSAPWGSDNAAVIAAEAVSRLTRFAPPTQIGEYWPRYVDALGFTDDAAARLTNPDDLVGSLTEVGDLAGYVHAITHTTIAPTIVRAGDAINVIPGEASVDLDIRHLPGETPESIDAHLRSVLGELMDHIEIVSLGFSRSSVSPLDTALYRTISEVINEAYPGAEPLPFIAAGGSDARFYRWRGRVAYGFSVLGPDWDYGTFRRLIHGNDERIDVDSVRRTATALHSLVLRFHG